MKTVAYVLLGVVGVTIAVLGLQLYLRHQRAPQYPHPDLRMDLEHDPVTRQLALTVTNTSSRSLILPSITPGHGYIRPLVRYVETPERFGFGGLYHVTFQEGGTVLVLEPGDSHRETISAIQSQNISWCSWLFMGAKNAADTMWSGKVSSNWVRADPGR